MQSLKGYQQKSSDQTYFEQDNSNCYVAKRLEGCLGSCSLENRLWDGNLSAGSLLAKVLVINTCE